MTIEKNNIFVLSYSALDMFFRQNTLSSKYNYHIIDNGNQKYSSTFGCNYYGSTRNIGCAGGWNLICSIAFDSLKLDKIVVTQDDVTLPIEVYDELFEVTYSRSITGAIQPFFEFSTFCITKEVWDVIGKFDENFINVYSEDADYKQRCMLSNVHINSLYLNNKDVNASASIKNNPELDRIKYNRAYLQEKWGESVHPSHIARNDFQPPFKNKKPFGYEEIPISYIPITNRITKVFGNVTELPSITEYERWKLYGYTHAS